MRIQLKIKLNRNGPIPFNYQPQLTAAIHRWLGKNEWHNATSLYSFSWLQGGHKVGRGLMFEHGATLDISAYDNEFMKRLIAGIKADNSVGFDMAVSEITICDTPSFSNKEVFQVSSPVLVKRTIENKEVHYTYDQEACGNLLTETLKRKLRLAGLPDDSVTVSFQRDYARARLKLVYYGDVGNKVSICPIIIEGSPEQINFAWNVGIGNSTGIGFGALK